MSRRKPDVRFGEPDENMSGIRHVRLSDVRFIQLYPVIGRLLYLKRLKSGHKCPVIGRLLYLKRLKTGRYIRFKRPKTGRYIRFSDVLEPKPVWNRFRIDQNRFQTGSKPVWNRLWSIRTLYPVFRRLKPDITSENRI